MMNYLGLIWISHRGKRVGVLGFLMNDGAIARNRGSALHSSSWIRKIKVGYLFSWKRKTFMAADLNIFGSREQSHNKYFGLQAAHDFVELPTLK